MADNTTAQAERTVTAKGVPLIRMVYARHTTDGHSTQIVGVTEDVARSLHRVLGQVLGIGEGDNDPELDAPGHEPGQWVKVRGELQYQIGKRLPDGEVVLLSSSGEPMPKQTAMDRLRMAIEQFDGLVLPEHVPVLTINEVRALLHNIAGKD